MSVQNNDHEHRLRFQKTRWTEFKRKHLSVVTYPKFIVLEMTARKLWAPERERVESPCMLTVGSGADQIEADDG